jgi:hypothetical protein
MGLVAVVVLGGLVSTLWHMAGVTYLMQIEAFRGPSALAALLVGLAGLLAIHEIIHALLHPGNGTTGSTVLGVTFRPMLLYAAYLGAIGRNRYVAVLLAPLVLLSVLPASLSATGLLDIAFSPLLVALTVVNAASSGVDLLGAALILWQVPGHSVLQNHGWPTYWKPSKA